MAERKNISIPEDLARRMGRVKEPVNWSQVAAQSFEAKLAEIASRKVEKEMEDVIQRLRVSRLKTDNEEYIEGFNAGQRWAMESAEWDELERVAKEPEREPKFESNLYEEKRGGSLYFQRIVDEYQRAEDSDWYSFWAKWGSVPFPTPKFVNGFWHGAISIYREVKEKI